LKNLSSSGPAEGSSVVKLRTKVTTLEEVIKAQSAQLEEGRGSRTPVSMSGRLPGLGTIRSSTTDSKSNQPPSILISGPTLDTDEAGTGNCRDSGGRRMCTRVPAVTFNDPEDLDQDLSPTALEGDVFDESSEGEGRTCCCGSPRSSSKRCCGGETRIGSVSGQRPYFRSGWERLSSGFPSWLLSLLGFISKIYWRFVDSVLGVGTPYRDENGEGNEARRNEPKNIFVHSLQLLVSDCSLLFSIRV
jgi:hypothetical protein